MDLLIDPLKTTKKFGQGYIPGSILAEHLIEESKKALQAGIFEGSIFDAPADFIGDFVAGKFVISQLGGGQGIGLDPVGFFDDLIGGKFKFV